VLAIAARIERCGSAPTFPDLGRLLDISRQGTREQALEAAGRRALDAQRMLEPAAMRSTHHVLRVIRVRLERYPRDLSAASARR